MRHFRQISAPQTFTDLVTIQCEGHDKCGADFVVQVEFEASPGHWDASVGQGDAGERKILGISWPIFAPGLGKRIVVDTKPIPDFMVPYLIDCINIDSLYADFSEG
jgi:hypothetical protein